MPADSRLKALAHEIELERRHALDLSPGGEEEDIEEFDDPERKARARRRIRRPELRRCRTRRGDHERNHAPALPDRRPRAGDEESAIVPPEAAPEDLEPERESAYATRERLRGERRRLVGDVARRTGKSHREVQARINRATRARSVSSATIEQLERGNEMLRRELWR